MLDNTDTEGTETEVTETDTETDTENTGLDSDGDTADPTKIQEAKPAPLTPFAQGKEKFKINGEEHEWDWETTKRYAQLGRNGQLAMERAAQVEAKSKTAYQQILKAAQTDPEGLLEILNPNYKRSNSGSPRAETEDQDPRDARIRQLEEQVSKFSGHLEGQEVEQARKEIDSELDDSAKKFPTLKDEVYREYVKNQYKRYLNQGITDISIEDIAFEVHQKYLEQQKAKNAERKASLDLKRKNSPAHSISGSSGSSDRHEGETGIEYARRLAGLT